MCIKIDNRMSCYQCGYPDCEAFFLETPEFACSDTQEQFDYKLRVLIRSKLEWQWELASG